MLTAARGLEALQRSHDHQGPIHLMMTDVVMPGMSGPELAERITATRPGLRILYTSGHADALGPHGALPPGMAFVHKPLIPDALADRVREILDLTPSGRIVVRVMNHTPYDAAKETLVESTMERLYKAFTR